MDAKLRILIPIHPPKLDYLANFLRSFERAREISGTGECQIVLVATTFSESAFLLRACRYLGLDFEIEMFVVEGYVEDCLKSQKIRDYILAGASGGIAILKKMIGLHWASNQPDAMNLCIDVDTFCAHWSDDVISRIYSNYDQAHYFGCTTSNETFLAINRVCMSSVCDEQMFTKNTNLPVTDIYTWFFEAPAYLSDDLRGYFGHVIQRHGTIENYMTALKWHNFEHTMFMYYRLLNNAHMIDYSELGISQVPEEIGTIALERVFARYNYKPIWMRAYQFFHGLDNYGSNIGPALLYHFDRL